MKVPKCANCGTQALETYTKQGLKIYVCPHVEAKNVKRLNGSFMHLEIHCTLNVKGLKRSFETMVRQRNGKLTLETLGIATKETIPDVKLLENANLAIMLGLPVDELGELFKAGFKLGLATGITTDKAIDALCRGVGRRSRLILDNIGIAFKANEAYEWFKREHNLEKLNESERTEAWQLYAIKEIKEKASALK